MASLRPTRLTPDVDPTRDHSLGGPRPDFTLVEYGSYACEYCHAAHEVVTRLRERFGERMRYVYRHLPIADRAIATQAAELAEYAAETENRLPGRASGAHAARSALRRPRAPDTHSRPRYPSEGQLGQSRAKESTHARREHALSGL